MAKRCIYADDFLDLFYVASAGQDKMFVKVVEQVVEDTPTADVVEVVMCKDCKHYKPYTKLVEDFDGECIVRECETDENEFCSYGTPKERGGEK